MGGHSGLAKTFSRLEDNVYWETICQGRQNFVSTCITCQQTRYVPKPPLGLPQPILRQEDIVMDFILRLPAHQGQTVIFIDPLRQHFGTLPTHFSICKIADLFTQMVCKLH